MIMPLQAPPKQNRQLLTIKKQQGVTLVELMVSVMIFSFALAAFSELQIKSLRFSQSATLRSEANWLLGDLIDRMRVNPRGVKDRSYIASAVNCTTPPAKLCASYLDTSNNRVDPANCTTAEMAIFDLWEVNCPTKVAGSDTSSTPLDLFRTPTLALSCVDCNEGSDISRANFSLSFSWLMDDGTLDQGDNPDLKQLNWTGRP